MSAIQQGWERGRSVFDVPSASTAPGAGNGADSTETGNDSAVTPAPDAGPAGTYQTEPASEDRGTSG